MRELFCVGVVDINGLDTLYQLGTKEEWVAERLQGESTHRKVVNDSMTCCKLRARYNGHRHAEPFIAEVPETVFGAVKAELARNPKVAFELLLTKAQVGPLWKSEGSLRNFKELIKAMLSGEDIHAKD